MKRIGFLIASVICGFTLAFAQPKAGFSASETVHDFGNIYEEDGNATCEFVITNTGNAPLEISKVTASCGCTTPDWTKTPVEPGKTGFVKATYGAKGRPGKFDKTISIYTNVQDAPFTVKIKGEVFSQKPAVDLQVKQTDLISPELVTEPVKNFELKAKVKEEKQQAKREKIEQKQQAKQEKQILKKAKAVSAKDEASRK